MILQNRDIESWRKKKNRIQQIPKNDVSYSEEDQEKKSSELNLI